MTLYVVTGPPCAGKSTWVGERAKRGDVVVDLDRIALAITSHNTEHHDYPPHIRRIAIELRRQLVAIALRGARTADAYVIHARPTGKSRLAYQRAGAVFVDLTAPLPILLKRASTERPPHVAALIAHWFDGTDEDI